MLASTLRGNVRNRSFQNLQQSLMHAFTRNVASDGGVLILAADLIDFVDVNDAGLGAVDVAVCRLQQLEDNVLNVFADVASFSERGGVDNRKRNIEHAGQGLREKRFAGSRRSDQHDVRL